MFCSESSHIRLYFSVQDHGSNCARVIRLTAVNPLLQFLSWLPYRRLPRGLASLKTSSCNQPKTIHLVGPGALARIVIHAENFGFSVFSEHHLYFKLPTGFDFDFNNTFPFLKGVTLMSTNEVELGLVCWMIEPFQLSVESNSRFLWFCST